jgi:pyrroline-5-carboxylate reductase
MLEGKKIGFIGAGMMAEAIARGLLKAGVTADNIMASDPDEKRRALFNGMGIKAGDVNRAVAESSDILILAVKPFVMPDALDGLADVVTPRQLVISIAAGITAATIEQKLEAEVSVIRVMPNTPCLIGEGAIAVAPGRRATSDQMDLAAEIFGACGVVVRVTEDKMDAVTGLSGSGPAYVYIMIEALTAGGLQVGLPRDAALTLAAQTVLGSAKMVIDTGGHPAELRDKVTTPGGTTISGIAALEEAGFRSALMKAVAAATMRSKAIGNASKS